MGPGPAQRPWAGTGRGHFGQSCTLAKDKGGSVLSTQQHLLSPQVAWEGTRDIIKCTSCESPNDCVP